MTTYAMNAATFKKAVASITLRSGTLTKDIHRAAMAALIFSGGDNIGGDKNATPALQLVQALAPGMPRNKVINWFHYFTNVRISVAKQKDGSFKWSVKNLGPSHDEFEEIDAALFNAAADLPYWDLMPEADVREVEVAKLIANAIKAIDKAIVKGNLKADATNDIRIKGLRALAKAGTVSQEVPFDVAPAAKASA